MFPNVLVTSRQAYFTLEALTAIADTTLASLAAFEHGKPLSSEVTQALIAPG